MTTPGADHQGPYLRSPLWYRPRRRVPTPTDARGTMREPTTHSRRASLALALETARLSVRIRARDTQVVLPTALLWLCQPSWQTWEPGCGQTEHWTGRALAYSLSPSMVLGNPLVGSAPSPQPWSGPGVRHLAEGPAAGRYARVVVTSPTSCRCENGVTAVACAPTTSCFLLFPLCGIHTSERPDQCLHRLQHASWGEGGGR